MLGGCWFTTIGKERHARSLLFTTIGKERHAKEAAGLLP